MSLRESCKSSSGMPLDSWEMLILPVVDQLDQNSRKSMSHFAPSKTNAATSHHANSFRLCLQSPDCLRPEVPESCWKRSSSTAGGHFLVVEEEHDVRGV